MCPMCNANIRRQTEKDFLIAFYNQTVARGRDFCFSSNHFCYANVKTPWLEEKQKTESYQSEDVRIVTKKAKDWYGGHVTCLDGKWTLSGRQTHDGPFHTSILLCPVHYFDLDAVVRESMAAIVCDCVDTLPKDIVKLVVDQVNVLS